MRIAATLNGPPDSGHGGYVAGAMSELLGRPGADVWLRAPAPLETELAELFDGDHLSLFDGQTLIAEADALAQVMADPVPFVDLATAQAAGERSPALLPNPFETCFGCGRLRTDGLRVHPGPVSDGVVACLWQPRGRIAAEWIWSALDCTSGWAWGLEDKALITGRLTGGLLGQWELDPAGPYVLVGAQLDQAGRKHVSASALFTPSGERVAAVRGVWLEI